MPAVHKCSVPASTPRREIKLTGIRAAADDPCQCQCMDLYGRARTPRVPRVLNGVCCKRLGRTSPGMRSWTKMCRNRRDDSNTSGGETITIHQLLPKTESGLLLPTASAKLRRLRIANARAGPTGWTGGARAKPPNRGHHASESSVADRTLGLGEPRR